MRLSFDQVKMLVRLVEKEIPTENCLEKLFQKSTLRKLRAVYWGSSEAKKKIAHHVKSFRLPPVKEMTAAECCEKAKESATCWGDFCPGKEDAFPEKIARTKPAHVKVFRMHSPLPLQKVLRVLTGTKGSFATQIKTLVRRKQVLTLSQVVELSFLNVHYYTRRYYFIKNKKGGISLIHSRYYLHDCRERDWDIYLASKSVLIEEITPELILEGGAEVLLAN